MAKKNTSVWGIDIGQCALKALRCTVENGEIVADAFDYLEYPKILTQPEADPRQLVKEALTQFLSRNGLKGSRVAISVPGQTGLTKFFKPPPMDKKRVADIVKYEARQQIPFSLDEVVWDFQQMAGSQEDEDLGLLLESEIGLFAMKRDQVYRAMRPFDEEHVELDIIQLSPLCIYNFVSYDVLGGGPSEAEFDPDNPPESLVVLAMGTDTTDLVITNGFRVWQRSLPVGGNHFTKQLTRSMKLTFAKAEHLKRNAREAEDPKKVFQAMRPVFNDLVTEVQRSISYFQGIDRKAKITGVVLLGNAVKLPGLQQFLTRNLGYKIVDFKSFARLQGSSVISSPVFKDNMPAFAVCYGLCLQGLGRSKLTTNLVPREILNDRMIRAKKPWALASVSALLLACAFNFFFQYRSWRQVQPERAVAGVSWSDAEQKADAVVTKSTDFKTRDSAQLAELEHVKAIGAEVGGNADRRLLWLELLKAINEALPREPGGGESFAAPTALQKPFPERRDVYIQSIESEYFPDLTTWFTKEVRKKHMEALEARGGLSAAEPAGESDAGAPPADEAGGAEAPAGAKAPPPTTNTADSAPAPTEGAGAATPAAGGDAAPPPGAPGAAPAADPSADGEGGPTGPGWVIELEGYHFFNKDLATGRAIFVRKVLLKNLEEGEVELPISKNRIEKFTMKELGIGYAVLVTDTPLDMKFRIPNPEFVGLRPTGTPAGQPEAAAPANPAAPGAAAAGEPAKDLSQIPFFPAPKYSFVIQFCWQERLLTQRLEARRAAAEQASGTPETPEAQPADEKAKPQPAKDDVAGI